MNIATGIVEDIMDPLELGRVRIRINGIHSPLKVASMEQGEGIPTDVLPWATVIQSVTSAAKDKVGVSPTGIEVGSWVVVTATDPNWDVLFVLGTIAGKDDIHEAVKGLENDIHNAKKDGVYSDEPASPYAPEYQKNKVITTASGHLIEIDDTDGAERIHVYHKSGTFIEIHNDGVKVDKVVGDNYSISLKNNNLYADGVINIIAVGDCNVEGKNVTVKAEDSCSVDAKTINATADTITIDGGTTTVKGDNITVDSSGTCTVKGTSVSVTGSSIVDISSGGPVKISGAVIALKGLTSLNI